MIDGISIRHYNIMLIAKKKKKKKKKKAKNLKVLYRMFDIWSFHHAKEAKIERWAFYAVASAGVNFGATEIIFTTLDMSTK